LFSHQTNKEVGVSFLFDPKRASAMLLNKKPWHRLEEDGQASIVRGRRNGRIIHSQGEFFTQLSRESNLKIGSLFLQFCADPSEHSGTVMIDALVGELPTVVSKIA
jgi:hypothetical protein